MQQIKRFIGSASGSIAIGFMVLLPGLLLIAGLAIDISVLNAQRKFVQAQADLAAISAIHNMETPESVYEAARDTIVTDVLFPMSPPAHAQVQLGTMDSEYRFQKNVAQDTLENVTAVRVIASSKARMPMLGRFLSDATPVIQRDAVAMAEPRVSYSLSNCLLSLNLLNGMVRPLVGANADVLCSGNGLRINAVALMDKLSLQMSGITPESTYGNILDAQIELGTLVDLAMQEAGLGVAAGGSVYADQTVRLDSFVQVSPALKQVTLGSYIPPMQIRVDDIIFGGIEVLGAHIADLGLDLDLGPLGHVGARMVISEPRKVVLGARPGDPNAHAETAQIRLEIDDLSIADLFSLSLKIGVANAETTLSATGESCGLDPELRAAVFSPVSAQLLDVEVGVTLLSLPLGSHVERARTQDLTYATSQQVSFTHEEVENGTIKTFAPVRPGGADNALAALTGSVSDMLFAAQDDLGQRNHGTCTGIFGCTLAGLSQTLNSLITDLGSVALSALNGTAEEGRLLHAVLDDVLGIGLAEAELQVLSVDCTRRLGG